MNFWKKLKEEKGNKPILVLAPMADVTDRAFRFIIAKYGKPDVTWTEFVSSDGLFRGGKEALINDLSFTEGERPIVAQFFTASPEMMKKSAELARELGFDGIDINMGCPDKGVEKQGAGAGLIKNPKLAQEIILAAKDGAGDLPVSVKTRIGYNKNELETWLPAILETKPAMVTIHARTRKQMSDVPAMWENIKRAVEIRNEMKSETLIFGNGDVLDVEDAKQKAKDTGCDGVMFGRAIFGNPWLFAPKGSTLGNLNSRPNLGEIKEKLKVLIEHTKKFEELVEPKAPKGQGKSFAVMKKHFKAYVNGFDGAKELRAELMEAKNSDDVENTINMFLKNNSI